MARAAYLAPGVYVEEIPSSRQPIAGVGTNTVGFIGLVPDEIWHPVRNPNYDPVMAQSLHAYRLSRAAVITSGSDDQRSRAQANADADAAPLRARQVTLQTRVDALVAEARTLAEAAETAKHGVDAAAAKLVGLEGRAAEEAAAELSAARSNALAAQQASELKQEELKNEQFELENLKGILSANTTATTTAGTRGGAAPTTGGAGGGTGDGGAAAGGNRRAQPGTEDTTYRHSDPDPELTRPSMFRPYYLQKFTIRAAEFDTKLCTNYSEYVARFGNFSAFKDDKPHESDPAKKTFQPLSPGHHLLTHAVNGFFANGGTKCFVARVHPDNIGDWQKVLGQFESIEDVAIIAAPGVPKSKPNWDVLQSYCESDSRQNVFAILDSPLYVEDEQGVLDTQKLQPDNPRALMPRRSTHAAFYFPWVQVMDPAKRLQDSDPAWGVDPRYRGLTYVAPSGHMAGIYSRTESSNLR